MAIWDDLINEEDAWVIENCGFGARRGFGTRPALAIIDAQYNFIGERLPARESIAHYPSSIGIKAWESVEHIAKLLKCARENDVPVVYTRAIRSDKDVILDSFRKKRKQEATKVLHAKANGAEIVDEIKPLDGEVVVDKKYASAFFATPFETLLRSMGIDTLIVTGFVTAGCIRATVVDAASYNYNVILPEECVNDRIEASHKINMLDMDLKYADVMPVDEVMKTIRTLKR